MGQGASSPLMVSSDIVRLGRDCAHLSGAHLDSNVTPIAQTKASVALHVYATQELEEVERAEVAALRTLLTDQQPLPHLETVRQLDRQAELQTGARAGLCAEQTTDYTAEAVLVLQPVPTVPRSERQKEPKYDEPTAAVVEATPRGDVTGGSAQQGSSEELRRVPRRPGAGMSVGALVAHARFLQRYFRRKGHSARESSRRLGTPYTSPWRRGGPREVGPVRVDVARPACQGRGFAHATEEDFAVRFLTTIVP